MRILLLLKDAFLARGTEWEVSTESRLKLSLRSFTFFTSTEVVSKILPNYFGQRNKPALNPKMYALYYKFVVDFLFYLN